MAVRLPSKEDFGPRAVPNAQRGIVQIDGGQVARAVQGAGRQLQDVAQGLQRKADADAAADERLRLAAAQSDFQRRKIEILSGIENDPELATNYESAGKRYDEAIKGAYNEVSSGLKDGKLRQLLKIDTDPDIARGRAAVDSLIGARRKDAFRASVTTNALANRDAALKSDEETATKLIESTNAMINAAVARGYYTQQEGVELRGNFVRDYDKQRLLGLPDDQQIRILERRLRPAAVGGGDEAAYRNNIGNMVATDAPWHGKGDPYKAFETFATPEAGVAANFKNVRTIAERRGGSITLKDLAAVWAPADDGKDPMLKGNDPAAWAKSVAKTAGIAPDAPLPLDDAETMAAVMRGINRHEHGRETVPASAYSDGVRAVLENRPPKLPAGDPRPAKFRPLYTVDPKAPGLSEPGNIDLLRRPSVPNADGSTSSVRSMSVNIEGQEVLIPTVSEDGRIMSDDEAVAQYRQTGRHLGKFDSPENATAYAERLHDQQAALGSERARPFRTGDTLLPSDARTLLNSALARKRQAEAEERRAARERQVELQATAKLAAEDQIASVRETGRGVMADDAFANLIRAAYPDSGDADRILKTYEDERAFFSARQDVALATPQQEAELLKAQQPKAEPGQPSGLYDDQVRRRDLLLKAIQEKRKALAADPAAFVLSSAPAVREAFAAAQENPELLPQAVAKLRQAQTDLGVPDWRQRVLTEGQAADIVGQISKAGADPEKQANAMEGLRQTYGTANWPAVMRDLQAAKLPPEFAVLGRLTLPSDARVRVDLAAAFSAGKGTLEKGVAQTDKRDIADTLRGRMEDLRASLYAQGSAGSAVFDQEFDAAYHLALQYANRDGRSASTAAVDAYNNLIGGRYDFGEGWRAPKGRGRDAAQGLATFLDELKPDDLAPLNSLSPGVDEARRRELTLYYAKRGQWVNNPDESGFILRFPDGALATRPDGSLVELRWSDIDRLTEPGARRASPVDRQDPNISNLPPGTYRGIEQRNIAP